MSNLTASPQRVAYTVAEVAEMTGQSLYVIRRVMAEGHLRYQRAGRNVVIPAAAVDEWLNAPPTRPVSGTHGIHAPSK